MKALLTILATILLSFVGVTQSSASTLPPCAEEDSINCYWDANTMGNGKGSSFENRDGVITYTSPVESHTCADGAILVDARSCVFPVEDIWEPTQEDIDVASMGYVQATDGAWIAPEYIEEYETSIIPQAAHTVDLETGEPVQVTAPATSDDATAWQLWDATGAASLLPDTATQVSFLGHNTVGYPLTGDTVIVWDNFGNFYQFHIG